MIKTGKYQLVLTDWEMPGMDGITLCRLVREANLPSVYILLLTSHGAAAHAVEGLRAGANDFIVSPPMKPSWLPGSMPAAAWCCSSSPCARPTRRSRGCR